ncbi:MAG TPA: alpha-2-macroglobulin family protein, partial [Pricia sp.]|nr:alpha-2-macroglobulin family protein [Pricia sp.]
VATHIVELNDTSKTFTVPVTPDDLGGFAIHYSFSAYNSFQSGSLPVAVPYPTTDLEIETLTFRDKLEPGTNETWSFKIKGAKGDQVSAELLAGMYDASLDAFREHSWDFDPLMPPTYNSSIYTQARESFGIGSFRVHLDSDTDSFTPQFYDSFAWFGFHFGNRGYFRDGLTRKKQGQVAAQLQGKVPGMALEGSALNEVVIAGYGDAQNKKDGPNTPEESPREEGDPKKEAQQKALDAVKIRKNLQETAFFFPHLKTDKDGNVSFNFRTPEALTTWKLQLLAHTKSLESSIKTLETVTQKELMVIPNAPRFLREGDEISISTKIVNLTDKPLSGQAKLVLTDAVTHADISEKLLTFLPEGATPPTKGSGEPGTSGANGDKGGNDLGGPGRNFKVDSMGNTQISWRLKVPKGFQVVQYKIIATAGDFSDGEQNLLPVLTNRKLVTETLPMWVRSDQTRSFQLDKLKNNASPTLKNHKLTLEITSNPAWYAVQALPYLMEYPYDCNEQIFARYYANTMASHIANSNPRIQEVFRQWADSDALISNLEKNEGLKSFLIQETPWLRDAQSETEQKKRIALLFNMDKMKNERAAALGKLKNNQQPSGAWAWFTGGPDNRFITQHIVTGLGHLMKLGAKQGLSPETNQMIQNAIAYLDAQFVEEYDRMKKYADDMNDDHLSPIQIHYL